MKCYANSGSVAGASSKTLIAVLSGSSRRPHIKQAIIGCIDAPDDTTGIILIKPITVDGTSTSGTGYPNDVKDGTVICTVKVNYTVEPTFVSGKIFAYIPFNQRGTVIWSPPLESEITCELSTGTEIGLSFQMLSGKTGANYNVTVVWEE